MSPQSVLTVELWQSWEEVFILLSHSLDTWLGFQKHCRLNFLNEDPPASCRQGGSS